jgi:Ca2+-binding RTX toxin-like protein
MRSARILLVSLFAAFAVASPAAAGTVSVSGGVLKLEGGSDYTDVEGGQQGGDFNLYDYAETLEMGTGCTFDSPAPPIIGPIDGERSITCKGVTAGVEVTVGGEENFVYISSTLPKRLTGGDGMDQLIGSGSGVTTATGGGGGDYLSGGEAADDLDGGTGSDSLRGRGGTDRLVGGEGNDGLQGDDVACCYEDEGGPPPEAPPTSADVLEGGPGDDQFDSPDGADKLSGGDGRDTVFIESDKAITLKIGAGGYDVEDAAVFGADANVTGDERDNEISTGRGKDTIDPGNGVDKVSSGGGEDTISVRDGAKDTVSCGDGADRVTADAQDEIESSCEVVDKGAGPVGPGTPPPPPVVAPLVTPTDLKVKVKRKGRRITLTGRLVLPAGAAPALCQGGGVRLEIKGIGRRTIRRGTVLSGKCAFTVKLKGKASKRVRVTARFAGTPSLAPIVRVG